ncbi:MAG: hypothetical protein QM808_08840 [Steroidobacteraceae bacterium]
MNSLVLIASGMAGALFACLGLRFVWAGIATRSGSDLWQRSNAGRELLYVSSHAAIGGGVGLLFWLSWGFTALARFSWWQQGLGFGLANALVFGLLPLLALRSLLRFDSVVYWIWMGEVLITCSAAGIASSWSWQQAF